MDENRRPGKAGVDYNINNNYNNGNANRSITHFYVDRYDDNYNNNTWNSNNDERGTNNDNNDAQYRTSHSNGKNSEGGNPHINFKALAKTKHAKGGLSSRKSRGLSPAVLTTRQHNRLDSEFGGLDAQGDKGEDVTSMENNNNDHLGVDTSQRMQLISPPPEEMLRRGPGSSVQRSNATVNVPFTPSFLADSSPPPGSGLSTSKRKRTNNTQRPLASTSSGAGNASTYSPQAQQTIESTPNPKPRKQVRHAMMPSMESPTRSSFNATPTMGRSPSEANLSGGRKGALNFDKGKELNNTPTKPRRLLVQSPHAKNPDADWIPAVPVLSLSAAPPARRAVLSARRRSATPIPPYEPPTDVFTPPREVFLSPAVQTVSKSSKRKTPATKKKKKGAARASTGLRVVTMPAHVKQELPDHIDLSAPMPPPSPSDDPLLLSGPPEPESSPLRRVARRQQREVSVQVEAEVADIDVLPPSSPEPPLNSEDAEALRTLDWHRDAQMTSETEDSMMRLDPGDADVSPVRLFDFDDLHDGADGGWGDSDEEELESKRAEGVVEEIEEGEGEFTGKWRMTKVRTKMDPPSSATRERMDAWGRPISPFPKIKIKQLDLLGEEDEAEREEQEEQALIQEEDEAEEEEVRRMSVEPDDQVNESTELPALEEEEEDDEEREVRQMSVEFDNDEEEEEEEQEFDLNLRHDTPPREPSPAPSVVDRRSSNIFAFPSLEYSEAGPSTSYSLKDVPRSPSAFESNSPFVDEDTQMRDPPAESDLLDDDDEEDGSSDAEAELGLVKITSADPRAAARAAAILKQHDYDCYTKIVMKRRQSEAKQRRASISALEDFAKDSRRRDLASSGISKSVGKNARRSTLAMGVIGDRVFIPGTPVTTLPALLREAELEVEREYEQVRETPGIASRVWSDRAWLEGTGQRDPFKTPFVDKHRSMAQIAMSTTSNDVASDKVGERPWTREEWKYLDACFTDQRLDLGANLEGAEEGTMAPVDMVSVEDVVARFVALVGGAEIMENFGDAWSKDNLLERACALQRKQRAGHVARPSTPYTPFSSSRPIASSSIVANALDGELRAPRMEVPDFTPLVGRRTMPHPRKSGPVLPSPVVQNAPFSNLPVEKERLSTTKRLPPTLLAPRYSHLLEEAIAISHEGELAQVVNPESGGGDSSFVSESDTPSFEHSAEDTSKDMDELEEETSMVLPPPPHIPPQPNTVGNRVKCFLFSYLPSRSKPHSSLPVRKPQHPRQPGLPLPPSDILEKPRGPVTTPARPALPRMKAPKELVNLNHAPPLPSALPRPKAKPQRLVELHPLPPPPIEKPSVPRPRRSSGSSVKDLVRGFEEMDNKEKERSTVKRVKSINEMRAKAGSGDSRPRWK